MPSISVNYVQQQIAELEQYILTLPIPQSLSDINPLSDIIQSVPNNGDVILWDQGQGKWIITSIPGGTLAGLADVQITSLALNNILVYNGTKWVNQSANILLDTQYLKLNGTNSMQGNLNLNGHNVTNAGEIIGQGALTM